MRISIDDTLAEGLGAGLKPGQSVEKEIERRLVAGAHVPATQPLIVLNTEEMDAIAERLGTGLPIRTKVDLLRAIDQTAQLTLGNERLVFTPSQFKQIEDKASRIGETVTRFVGRVAAKLLTDVFLVEPGSQGVFYTPGFDPDDAIEDEEPQTAGAGEPE